jgi:hypothetical protein
LCFAESTASAAVESPVWLVSDVAAAAALECVDAEVSAGPLFPWLAPESRVVPPVLLCAPLHAASIKVEEMAKTNFFMGMRFK